MSPRKLERTLYLIWVLLPLPGLWLDRAFVAGEIAERGGTDPGEHYGAAVAFMQWLPFIGFLLLASVALSAYLWLRGDPLVRRRIVAWYLIGALWVAAAFLPSGTPTPRLVLDVVPSVLLSLLGIVWLARSAHGAPTGDAVSGQFR